MVSFVAVLKNENYSFIFFFRVKHVGSKPLDREGKETILRNRHEAQKRYQVSNNCEV